MDDLYTIVLHHGGKFVSEPHLKYVGGETDAWEMVDIDKLSITELQYYFQQHGYNIESYKKVYWLEYGFNLEDGLRVLETDEDIHRLYASAKAANNNELEFYFDQHLLDDTNGEARPVDGRRDDNTVCGVDIDIIEDQKMPLLVLVYFAAFIGSAELFKFVLSSLPLLPLSLLPLLNCSNLY
ncbi:hypothetical protein CDL15_Pgr028320 [Punica granatum]|uniref:PB1-like domain-containing protein n=1 Tax=Punica granatum TaxID=22663 RepID=A0A218W3P8_PUNGR|nr:hypothetical protein CDL15_Pgr028320 [Punica granatum]